MNSRALCVVLTLSLGTFGTAIHAQIAADPPAGSGTEQDPYLITSLENLYWISLNPGEWTKYFLQIADIEASATATWLYGWMPLGWTWDWEQSEFAGVYDGNGFTINGLTVDRPFQDLVGFIGQLGNGGQVTDLGLINSSISGRDAVGALVGMNDGGAVANSYAVGGAIDGRNPVGGLVGANIGPTATTAGSHAITSVAGLGYVGGLVGGNSGAIEDSCAHGDVTATRSVGGLVGGNYLGGTITTSCATGNVTGEMTTGGLLGEDYDGSGSISNSYSRGSVTRSTGSSAAVAGFLGVNRGASVTHCYSTGNVAYAGSPDPTDKGFVGEQSGTPQYAANFFDLGGSGQSSGLGATAATTAEMTTSGTFVNAGWDSLVWFMDAEANDGYPYLSWENPDGTPIDGEPPESVTLYTIELMNAGPSDASGVTVTTQLPGDVTLDEAIPTQGACDASAGTLTCEFGTLASSSNASVTVKVTGGGGS